MDLQLYCVKACRETAKEVPTFWTETLNEKEPWAPLWNTEMVDKYAAVYGPMRQASGTTVNTLRIWAIVLNIAQKHQSRFMMDWRGRWCVCVWVGVVCPQSSDYTASMIISSFTHNRNCHCSGFIYSAHSPSCLTKGTALASNLGCGIRMMGGRGLGYKYRSNWETLWFTELAHNVFLEESVQEKRYPSPALWILMISFSWDREHCFRRLKINLKHPSFSI